MRIDPKHTVVPPIAAKTARDVVAPKQDDAGSATVVELSSAGASVSASKSAHDVDKVARVRELIAKGEYKVDLDLLAARISEDEILGRGRW